MNKEPLKPLPPGNGHFPLLQGLTGNPARNGHSGPGTGIDAGNQAEFALLYDRHGREVWALAYARWMNADTALDIMQETFLRLWKQWEKHETINNPRAWLLRVARNLAEDYAKSAFRRNGTTPTLTLNGVPATSQMPLENLEQEERFAQVRQGLAELSPEDREILTLRYALDYDTEIIAEKLSINSSAVHMRLSRARGRLAERLKIRGLEPTQ